MQNEPVSSMYFTTADREPTDRRLLDVYYRLWKRRLSLRSVDVYFFCAGQAYTARKPECR